MAGAPDNTDVLISIQWAIGRLNKIKIKNRDTLKAFLKKLNQLESCIRSVNSRENQLHTLINNAQANRNTTTVWNIEYSLKQSALSTDQLKSRIDCVEEELSALENIRKHFLIGNNKTEVAMRPGDLTRHTTDASDNRTLLCLDDQSLFGNFQQAIESFSINLNNRYQANRNHLVTPNSWHNDSTMRMMTSLFLSSAGCEKNDVSFKFLVDTEQHGGKMLDIRLYDRTDCVWKSFCFPEMQEVRLAVTPTSNSISVRWTKPPSSLYSSNYFSGFSEFILQHKVNVGIAGWLNPFLSSDPLAASVKYHKLNNLSSSTDYEIRLLCRMQCGLYVPSTTSYIRTTRKNHFVHWNVIIGFVVLLLAIALGLGISFWAGAGKGEVANNYLCFRE